jgi:hypothetical protein
MRRRWREISFDNYFLIAPTESGYMWELHKDGETVYKFDGFATPKAARKDMRRYEPKYWMDEIPIVYEIGVSV